MTGSEAHARSSEQPRRLGPYQVLEVLGRGGMGVVYRARHERTGELAAVKTVLLPNEALLQSLRREIRALARLRHPGIVPIVAVGLEQELPWYAMELLEGRTLHDARRDLQRTLTPPPDLQQNTDSDGATPEPVRQVAATGVWADPVPTATAPLEQTLSPAPRASHRPSIDGATLRGILTLVSRLCSPLGYLHGEGIVHRDLKPGNVIVQPDGRPVLMDFGLAIQSGAERSREALEVGASAAGTLAYIAPEQLQGELVDARADLYSIGCVMYELLTGQPPFKGEMRHVIHQHLHVRPGAPSSQVDGLPPDLDELVLRLLEKEPRRRLGYADDLAAALMRLGAEDAGAVGGCPKARAYLYRPGLAGRNGDLAWLQNRMGLLLPGDGAGVVLLGGESGVGKTRLLAELVRSARGLRALLLGGECVEGGGPLEGLRKPLQRIADRCRERGVEETDRLLGRRGPVLALFEPELRGLPGQQQYGEPSELPAAAARLRLFSYLVETFGALAEAHAEEGGPTALLLDDLQWADDLVLGFLEHAAQALPMHGWPLLVAGAYRVEEVGEGLQSLLQSRGVEALPIGRLEEPAVRSMTGDMLALEPAPALFSSFLARQSAGNPFFVAEYLRAAVEEGLLWRNEAGHWQVTQQDEERATEATFEALRLPGSLRELVERRLASLTPQARELVEAAAVLGRESLLNLLELAAPDVAHTLDELLQRQVLETIGTDRIRFVHDKLREGALGRIEPTKLPAVHRAAALAIEGLGLADERLASLGRHWELALEAGKARRCYLAGARQAAHNFSRNEAERLYRDYLRLVEQPTPESILARNELGERVFLLCSRNSEAIAEHTRAADEARSIGDRALHGESLRMLGAVYQTTGQSEQARQLYERALELHREVGDRLGEARVLGSLGNVHLDQGRPEQSRELFEKAVDLLREAGDRRREGTILGNLGVLHAEQGRPEQAWQLLDQALAIHRELGDRGIEGRVLGNLGILEAQQGRPEQARQLYEQALAIHREVGDRRCEGIVLSNLAILHHQQGRLEQALQLHEQALAFNREVGDRGGEGFALSNLGDVQMDQGRPELARQRYVKALELVREVGDRRLEGIALGGFATLVCLATGDLATANNLAQQGEDLLAAAGDKMELGKILCVRGHLALAGGHGGGELLARALELAEAVGAGAQSDLSRDVARLRRACSAFEAGGRLVCGCCPEDLTRDQLVWLREHRRAAFSASGER